MDPVYIYFEEPSLDDENRFTLDFSDETSVHHVLFSPEKDYYVTSMNCDIQLLKDFTGYKDMFEDIKKLSNLSHLLLEKGPAYQNDIDKVFLFIGVPGTVTQKIDYDFGLSNAQINNFLYKFQFYDVKEQKIKDCSGDHTF